MRIVYERNNSGIYPFIIAPIPTEQDILILFPSFLTSRQNEFIDKTYKKLSTETSDCIVAQVYRFEKFYCYCISFFEADQKEIISGRKGLWLTIGGLIEDNEFRNKNILVSHYRLFLELFKNVLGYNLFLGESSEFLEQLQRNSVDTQLSDKISMLNQMLLFNHVRIYQRRNYIKRLTHRVKMFFALKRQPPKLILCSKLYSENDFKQIDLLFTHLNKAFYNFKKGYVSKDSVGAKYIKIMPILPEIFNHKKIRIHKLKNGSNYFTLR